LDSLPQTPLTPLSSNSQIFPEQGQELDENFKKKLNPKEREMLEDYELQMALALSLSESDQQKSFAPTST